MRTEKIKTIALICLLFSVNSFAVTGELRPVNNLFVLNPGPASPLPEAADLNFGRSGSLCVSSASARAYEPNEGIDHPPKGEFITLLKFDGLVCSDTTINGMKLKLAITNGNQSAGDIFNYRGQPGQFDLYRISNEWQQGSGSPLSPNESGLTYNGLVTLLEDPVTTYLETLYYDAAYSYSEGENWFTFNLDISNGHYENLLEDMESGETITLMLIPVDGSEVCFNMRAYVQYNQNGTYSYRETGPKCEVSVNLPFTDVDFDENGIIDSIDLLQITNNWLATGENLIGDISPLGGDGKIDFADYTVFSQYWKRYVPQPDQH